MEGAASRYGITLNCLPESSPLPSIFVYFREPKPFRFYRELTGESWDFSGRAPIRHKRRKRRNRLGLQALSLAPRFLIGVVQIHSSRPLLFIKFNRAVQ